MSFINKLFSKKEEVLEYFFALNIAAEKLSAALWTIQGKKLQILHTASTQYQSVDEINKATDSLLDTVLGNRDLEPQKILFGVPDAWLTDENLKDDNLKILRKLVKELELTPMAYVATSHAVVHFLEKQDGMAISAILIGFEKEHIEVIVAQGGKVIGTRMVERGQESGISIEKALLSFTSIETLPSKILIYGLEKEQLSKLRGSLLSYPWMSKLSFLHFPKIEILADEIEVDSVCLAGASELEPTVSYTPVIRSGHEQKHVEILEKESLPVADTEMQIESDEIGSNLKTSEPEDFEALAQQSDEETTVEKDQEQTVEPSADFGFVVGDVAKEVKSEKVESELNQTETEESNLVIPDEIETQEEQTEGRSIVAEAEDFDSSMPPRPTSEQIVHKVKHRIRLSPKIIMILVVFLIAVGGVSAAYIFIPKATVSVYVEPKTLEKDAQIIADPKQTTVDENNKIIPAQSVDTQVSGTATAQATGSKQIGDPAKGTVIIINNTDKGQNFAAGTILAVTGGLKFKLDNTASVSATAVDSDSKSTVTVTVTATVIGADGNLPSQTNLTIASYPSSQFVAKSQGNFSGGTSKQVTVVSSDDQKALLASLSSDLRKKAASQLQDKMPDKKILPEALTDQVIKKSFSKAVGDQASQFGLDLTAKYTGSAFNEQDLRDIVGKLVTTQVPDGFTLDLSDTSTQADVSSVDKNGRVIFLAKFQAKMIPKIDTQSIKNQIKGKTAQQVDDFVKKIDNVLGSDVQFTPKLPKFLQRIPLLSKNINVEVGFK